MRTWCAESDDCVPSSECAPNKVLDHTVVFILSCTVASVEMNFLLSKAMLLKEVDLAHVASFPQSPASSVRKLT